MALGRQFVGLQRRLSGRLLPLRSPLESCREGPESAACRDLFRELKNPYYIGDDPALTQTTGWVDAWTSQASAYAVEARSASDVAAAVNFAHDNNLRLSHQGRRPQLSRDLQRAGTRC